MSEYKYERVEGVTVGWVVDSMLDGDDFYFYQGLDSYQPLTFELMNFDLGTENIYTRKEVPWYKGLKGTIIMVSRDGEKWCPRIFVTCYVGAYKYFDTTEGEYNYARPLTTAERDAIKAQD